MKSSTVWHGHSTRRFLSAGTARKVSGSLLRGRRNRLITQTKKNRKFPLGNALLYISLLSVVFGRVRPIQGRTLFLSLGSIGSIKNRATSVHNLSVRIILFLHLCHYSHSGIDQGLISHFYLSKVARSYSAVISMKRERYTSGGSFRRKI